MESVMEVSLASVFWRLAGVLALIFANGFFVAAEFSIVTVRKTRIDQLVAEGHRGARAVRHAVTQPDRYIAATQLGITMASLGLGWVGEPALATIIQPAFDSLPAYIAVTTAHTIAVTIAFTIITAFTIVFGFADLTAGQVMLPRTELVAVAADTPRAALTDQIARGGHTRLPVYRSTLDDIVGMLHVTDVLKTLKAGAEPVTAGALAREALIVPETTRADDLLAEMRRRGVREALVIDEYGGTAGLVTFESLMERIVGDLGSAFGGGAAPITVLPDGSAQLDGPAPLGDVHDPF